MFGRQPEPEPGEGHGTAHLTQRRKSRLESARKARPILGGVQGWEKVITAR
jgi:hypothetical protein